MKIPPFQIENYINKIADEKVSGCLVFGPETSLVNYRFNEIAKKISPDLSDVFNVVNLSKERISEDKAILVDEFFAMSMLGGRRLILIKDTDAKLAESLKILFADEDFAKKSENFILIQGGDLEKSSALRKLCEDSPNFAAIACYEDSEVVIKKFIFEELTKRKIKFDNKVTQVFIEKIGLSRITILSEINKIEDFLGEEKNLDVAMLEGLISSESEASINDFILNFTAKKFDLALLAAEKNFRDGVEAIAMIRMLSAYLQKLYQARIAIDFNGVDFESAVKNQRLFFKVEPDFRKNLQLLSLKFLTKNLQILEELELKAKSGQVNPKLLVVSFVQSFLAVKSVKK